MRDIRFRAFDKEKNIMIYDYDQSIGKIYNLPLGSSLRDCVFIIGLANKTLMQFTGLYDKNGKEIYEGDVVQSEIYPNLNNKEVKIIDALSCEPFDYFMQGEDFEVIGNIYENAR